MQYYRARSLAEFEIEQVGEDRVLFDPGSMQYHTLSRDAFMIWVGLNGFRSEEDVALLVYGDRSEASVMRVKHAVELLADGGLLEGGDLDAPAFLTRRLATKLAMAGLAGMVGLPVVESITVPDLISAQTAVQTCIAEWENYQICVAGESCRCKLGCCCAVLTTQSWCLDRQTCEGAGRLCI
jgi:hypothetical protein